MGETRGHDRILKIIVKTFICYLLVSFSCLTVFAQSADTVQVARKHHHKTESTNLKEEITVDGKRFRVYNNWMNVGTGEGLNSALALPQNMLDVNLHFHVKKNYFQLGTYLSGDRFLSFNNYNLHLCYGKRWENAKRNIFICAGPSYSWGFPFIHGIYDPGIYRAYGGYADVQYIYKLAYDLGIGASAFADINTRQTVYGLRLELYFSGAFRGEGKKKASWMK